MSGKANYYKYGGSGGSNRGVSTMPNDIDLFGTKRVIGGPQIGPDGKVQFSPFEPKTKGIFGRQAARQADAMNQEAMMQMLMEQMAAQQEMQRIAAESAEAQKLAGVQGEETRKTHTRQQVLDIMKQNGVPYTEANFAVYDKALTDQRIRNALMEEQQQEQVMTAPGFMESRIRGAQQANLKPAYDNFRNSVTTTPADTLSTFDVAPLSMGPDRPFIPTQVSGPSIEQGVHETPGMTLPDGTTFPGKNFPIRQVTPGSVRTPINPDILNKAAALPPQPTDNPNGVLPMPPTGSNPVSPLDDETAMMIMQMLMQGRGVGMGGIGRGIGGMGGY